ncbi:FecR family protein [Pararcticibacter amylolyticus]|uniref:FecR protein domain-containing protein n=1 Tax=Pararcticibacter amylolyticus TaxID=2173175 RepID=A0A2U2PMS1_9SPHI|nr:FecR domain-containing protein [Pararcticibacter amylolyticus]PWG82479.1 hypothetical protein DDR33_01025 [Pararcticibacter amylolyticus]
MKKETLYKKYLHYEESDFLSDPSFQDYAFNPTSENEAFWREIAEIHPAKAAAIGQALDFLRTIRFKEQQPGEEQVNAAFNRHIESLRSAGLLENTTVVSRRPAWSFIRYAAAALTGILLLSGLYLLVNKTITAGELTVTTAFGETRQLTLPDGSHVELNANSSIRYDKNWKKGNKREIWLEGEALFKVVHTNSDPSKIKPEEYFVVHTKGLNVTVLGTVFDVRQRRKTTEVVLQRGKVKVSFDRKDLEDIILTPGKRIIYGDQMKKAEEDFVETKNYTAWKEKKLLLINPTLKEITRYLEDNFGQKITVSDTALNDKMIAGPIPLNSLDDALFVISTVSGVDIIRPDSSSILLKRR